MTEEEYRLLLTIPASMQKIYTPLEIQQIKEEFANYVRIKNQIESIEKEDTSE